MGSGGCRDGPLHGGQFRCGCEVAFTGGTAPPTPPLQRSFPAMRGRSWSRSSPLRVMSSDDFSLICERVPGAYFILGRAARIPVYREGRSTSRTSVSMKTPCGMAQLSSPIARTNGSHITRRRMMRRRLGKH